VASTGSIVLGLIAFGAPIIDRESPAPAPITFPRDDSPRFRDGKAWPEAIAGANRDPQGRAMGTEAGYTIVNARTIWDASGGAALGYCTDQNYADLVVLEHELKSYSVMFSMADIIRIMGPNTAEYLHMSDQIGTLEPGKLADIILLDGNPLEGIQYMLKTKVVLKGGVAMSKSRGNVVGAHEMADKYGADTGRLYTLFAAPPEKDLEWSEESIDGAWRFLNRVYRLIERHADSLKSVQAAAGSSSSPTTEKEKRLLRKAHQTLQRVTSDFETRWHFNSAIALIMELTNEIYACQPLEEGVRPEVQKQVLELLTLMLAPMTPHIAEEMWEILGHSNGLWTVSWPAGDAELAKDDDLELPVQINGKLRGKLKVSAGISQEETVALAKADVAIAAHLAGKRTVKIVYVPNKLLNLVVA